MKLGIFLNTFADMLREPKLLERIQTIQATLNRQSTQFYDDLVQISASLVKVPDVERLQKLRADLKEFRFNPTMLLNDSARQITEICVADCRTLKSHAKVPLLIHAKTDADPAAFIVKANDSVVQDHAVMVLLSIFKLLFNPINLKLTTYSIFPLSSNSGFIELI